MKSARSWSVLVVCLALSLALTACGGSDSKAKTADHRPKSQPTQGGTTLAALWPLTGLPAPDSTPKRPVIVVKIPNTAESQPQVGLSKADLVSEELVEGGITRLGVFYYSKVPNLVGPVRSMRASDIGIVKPAHAVIVASGAAPPTLNRLHNAKVPFYTGGTGYFRDSSASPYNLMVHLKQLARTMKKKAVVPASYLDWGSEKDFTGTRKAGTIAAKFSTGHTTNWKFTGGKYVNTNSYAPAGDQFKPDTVLVLRVREGRARYLDPAGNPVPITIFKGHGKLLMFHHGQVVVGQWSKKRDASNIKLSTKAGELKVPAGHVWMELVPVNGQGGHVSFTR